MNQKGQNKKNKINMSDYIDPKVRRMFRDEE